MSSTKNRDEIWNHDGEILGNAPRWATYRKQLNAEFPAPYRGGVDRLAQEMKKAVEMLDNLRPEANGKAFLGDSSKLDYTYPEVKNCTIPQKAENLDKVIADCVKLFNGMPDVSSPLTMSNVWPQPNNASIIASMLPLIFAPNIIEGEYFTNISAYFNIISRAKLFRNRILFVNFALWKCGGRDVVVPRIRTLQISHDEAVGRLNCGTFMAGNLFNFTGCTIFAKQRIASGRKRPKRKL